MPNGNTDVTKRTFASGIAVYTAEEFEAMQMEAEFTTCAGNHAVAKRVRWDAAVFDKDDNPYCNQSCMSEANAPMIKPQPKGTKVDGWDV